MTDPTDGPTPPEGLPSGLAADLRELSPSELRATIVHAQELLRSHGETDSPIEPEPGDDILRVTEHDGYTEVVKQTRCADGCADCPHGPYLYHVIDEPRPDGSHAPHWSFMGAVRTDDE
ncbi:hypothetical protein [Halorubrum sp. BV1]|uniref:hypothetical protein n=1 Tax=Halorubrum sp. BV1 TaxID=1498500 RepID=UPI000678E3BF|nr:hypothetical protein [Halorubrum sp. BV1]